MAKFAHADVLDGVSLVIKNGCTKMQLLSQYSVNDSYAAVQANKLAEVAMTSADFILSGSGLNRVLTVAAGKTANLTVAATGTDLHIAFCDGTRVLWVTDETTNGSAIVGATVTFPGLVYTNSQPV